MPLLNTMPTNMRTQLQILLTLIRVTTANLRKIINNSYIIIPDKNELLLFLHVSFMNYFNHLVKTHNHAYY